MAATQPRESRAVTPVSRDLHLSRGAVRQDATGLSPNADSHWGPGEPARACSPAGRAGGAVGIGDGSAVRGHRFVSACGCPVEGRRWRLGSRPTCRILSASHLDSFPEIHTFPPDLVLDSDSMTIS
jgi:hypothetical protein